MAFVLIPESSLFTDPNVCASLRRTDGLIDPSIPLDPVPTPHR